LIFEYKKLMNINAASRGFCQPWYQDDRRDPAPWAGITRTINGFAKPGGVSGRQPGNRSRLNPSLSPGRTAALYATTRTDEERALTGVRETVAGFDLRSLAGRVT
jgi:hypothetical protein